MFYIYLCRMSKISNISLLDCFVGFILENMVMQIEEKKFIFLYRRSHLEGAYVREWISAQRLSFSFRSRGVLFPCV